MALSAFVDATGPPTPAELDATLAAAARPWAELVAEVSRHAGDVTATWGFTSAKYGWSMRLVQGRRTLVYLTPQAGRMLVGVVLGEKAIAVAEAAGIMSGRTLEVVAAAPRYAEGRGVRFTVESDVDLEVALELARIKLGR